MDAVQQRGQLLVGFMFRGMIEVQVVQRLHYLLCHTVGQPCRKGNGNDENDDNGMKHTKNQQQCRCPTDGNAEYAAVIQSGGFIDGLLRQCGGLAGTAAVAGDKGCLDLLTVSMVFHGSSIGMAVEEHRAISIYPCQTIAGIVQPFQIAFPQLLRGACRQT